MNDQNDETQTYALLALAGVVALVLTGVLALAIRTHSNARAGADKPAVATAATMAPVAPATPAGDPMTARRIYFASGSDALPDGASQQLAELADAVRGQVGKVVLISGFHDASGDPARNAELAKRRAMAVRHALESNGLGADQIVMDKPELAVGGTDPREARRVEVRLR